MSKVILITGASAGLGESLATYLASKKYKVYGTSRSIQSQGKNFETLAMDVTDMASVQAAVNTIVAKEGRLDVVINNAGLGLATPFEHTRSEEVLKLFTTNILGVTNVCQAVLPVMRKQQKGHIINVSSIASEFGLPFRGFYCASKAALDKITEALRMEVGKYGIQACVLQPGGIQTDINKNRLSSPIPENSPYKDSFQRCHEIINASVSLGLPTASFGPKVEQIIHRSRLKRKYKVGKFTEKLSVKLYHLLPSSWFENILKGHYKV